MFIIRKIFKYDIKMILISIISSILLFLPYIFGLIGLSSIGPIAGGLFSTMQGTGILSGSLMAVVQSFAMSGYTVIIQSFIIIFWSVVPIFTFIKKYLFGNKQKNN